MAISGGVDRSGKITVFHTDGNVHTAQRSHPNYDRLKEAWNDNDEDAFAALCDVKQGIADATGGKISIVDGQVFYGQEVMDDVNTRRVLDMMGDGFSVANMLPFLEKLYEQTSFRVRNELLNFLQHENLPINEKGNFLGYKAVTSDFRDKYSRTMNNSPGCTVSMERAKVNDNPNETCSYGLHVGALEYVQGFGGRDDRIIIVEVDPRDVVSVPVDYNGQKLRCCKYEVLREYTGPMPSSFLASQDVDNYDDWDDDDEDYGDEEPWWGQDDGTDLQTYTDEVFDDIRTLDDDDDDYDDFDDEDDEDIRPVEPYKFY